MKTLKKTLCLVLAVVMALGVLVLPASAAEDAAEAETTSDAYKKLNDYGILLGSDKGAEEDRTVTRAEVATIAYRILTGDVSGNPKQATAFEAYASKFTDPQFKDDDWSWSLGYVGYAVGGVGIMQGDDGVTFRPQDPVTGEELVKVMLGCLGYGGYGEFTGEGWAERTLGLAEQIGILKGVTDVDMTKPVTRKVVAQIVVNTIDKPMVQMFNGSYSAYQDDTGRPTAPNAGGNPNPALVTDQYYEVKKDGTLTAIEANKNEAAMQVLHDDFGIPYYHWNAVVAKATFNHPANAVTSEARKVSAVKDEKIEPSYDSYKDGNEYGFEDLGDIYDALGLTAAVKADVYVDGVKDLAQKEIKDDKTVLLGNYGAHTLIYVAVNAAGTKEYTIVEIRTHLAVKGTDGKYTVSKTAKATDDTYAVTGYYTDRDDTKAFVVAADPADTDAEAAYKVEGEPIVISAILYGGSKREVKMGVIDGNKNNHIYGVVMGTTPDLSESSIGKSVTLFSTRVENNICYVIGTDGDAATTTVPDDNNYLIVKEAEYVEVTGKNPGYYFEVTGYTLAGTVETIKIGSASGEGAAIASTTDETDLDKQLDAYFAPGTLIHYHEPGKVSGKTQPYYYIDGSMTDSGTDIVKSAQITKTGDSDANGFDPSLTNYGNFLVNDDTLILLAKYVIDTTTKDADDYKFVGFEQVKFRDLPFLRVEDKSIIVGDLEDASPKILIQAFASEYDKTAKQYVVTAPGAGEYADVVVITGATLQVEEKETNTYGRLNYAYLYGAQINEQVHGDKYLFDAFLDGEAGTLGVSMNAGAAIKNDGLYTYGVKVNGGYNELTPLPDATDILKGGKIPAYNYTIDIEKGVLTYYPDAKMDPDDKYVLLGSTVYYFTLAKDVEENLYKFYTVAGDIEPAELADMGEAKKATAKDKPITLYSHDIFVQVDEFSRVNLIYIDTKAGEELKNAPAEKPGESHELTGTVGVSIYPIGSTSYWIVYYAEPGTPADVIAQAIEDAVDKKFDNKYNVSFKLGETTGTLVLANATAGSGRSIGIRLATGRPVFFNDVLVGAYGVTGRTVTELLAGVEGAKLGTGEHYYYVKADGTVAIVSNLNMLFASSDTDTSCAQLYKGTKLPANVVPFKISGTVSVQANGTLKAETVSGTVNLEEGSKLEAEKLEKSAQITAKASNDENGKAKPIMDVQTTNPEDVQALVTLTVENGDKVNGVIGAVCKVSAETTADYDSGKDWKVEKGYVFCFKTGSAKGHELTITITKDTEGDVFKDNKVPEKASNFDVFIFQFQDLKGKTGTMTIKVVDNKTGETVAAAMFTVAAE